MVMMPSEGNRVDAPISSPVPIKGTLPVVQYPFTLADIYTRYREHVYSYAEADQHLQQCAASLEVAITAEAVITSLFPRRAQKRSFARWPCVMHDAPPAKFAFNLLYQDTRIKLAVEEKLGTGLHLAAYQQDAHNLMEILATLLSLRGLHWPVFWQDLTDNDLEGLTNLVLNHYDRQRNQRLQAINARANTIALRSLGPTIESLALPTLIAHQVFAGTVWWHQMSAEEAGQWPPVGRFEIDDRVRFCQEVLQGERHLIFFFDDTGELIWDLALLQLLLHSNSHLRITSVVNNQVMYNNVNWDTLSQVLQAPVFQKVANSPRFMVLRENNFRPSFDLNSCSDTLLDTLGLSDLVFVKGVAGFEAMQELPVNTYYAFVVYSYHSQKVTGYEKGSGIFVRVPAGQVGYRYEKQTLRDIYVP